MKLKRKQILHNIYYDGILTGANLSCNKNYKNLDEAEKELKELITLNELIKVLANTIQKQNQGIPPSIITFAKDIKNYLDNK